MLALGHRAHSLISVCRCLLPTSRDNRSTPKQLNSVASFACSVDRSVGRKNDSAEFLCPSRSQTAERVRNSRRVAAAAAVEDDDGNERRCRRKVRVKRELLEIVTGLNSFLLAVKFASRVEKRYYVLQMKITWDGFRSWLALSRNLLSSPRSGLAKVPQQKPSLARARERLARFSSGRSEAVAATAAPAAALKETG